MVHVESFLTRSSIAHRTLYPKDDGRRTTYPSLQAGKTSVDVSDLNITMSDLDKSLEKLAIESTGISKRGYYRWVESMTDMDVIMTHPGMIGQPGEAVDCIFTDSTVTVSIFGYIVWSAIFMGPVVSSQCSFKSRTLEDRNVCIEFSIK